MSPTRRHVEQQTGRNKRMKRHSSCLRPALARYQCTRDSAALQILDEVALLLRREAELQAAVVMADDVEQRLEATVVVEAALRPREQRLQWSDRVRPVRATI